MYVPGPPAVQVPPLMENEDIASPSLLTGVLVAMGTPGSAASSHGVGICALPQPWLLGSMFPSLSSQGSR